MRTIFFDSTRRRWRSALISFAVLIGAAAVVAVLFFALGYFIGEKA